MTIKNAAAESFKNTKDPRKSWNQKHDFNDVIIIAILASMAGAKGFAAIGDFAEFNEKDLTQFLDLKQGVPSHDTFLRVLEAINPEEFNISFRSFVNHLQKKCSKLISIDGKTIRNSSNETHGNLHIVSAWCESNKIVLGQLKTDNKSNEIPAISSLLTLLNLNGALVTADALGCQRTIAQQIVSQGGDYLLALKANQKALYEDVMSYFDDVSNFEGFIYQASDKGHGRLEKRSCFVRNAPDWLINTHKWPHLKSIIMIESTRIIKEKSTTTKRYYISSAAADAEFFNDAVRKHWSIENELHWMLDVLYGQDKACIRNESGAENLTLIQKWALGALKQAQKPNKTLVSLQRKLWSSWDAMLDVLRIIFV